jgi:hypothetical protein
MPCCMLHACYAPFKACAVSRIRRQDNVPIASLHVCHVGRMCQSKYSMPQCWVHFQRQSIAVLALHKHPQWLHHQQQSYDSAIQFAPCWCRLISRSWASSYTCACRHVWVQATSSSSTAYWASGDPGMHHITPRLPPPAALAAFAT